MVCMAALYNSTYHVNIYDVLGQSNISWPPFGTCTVLYYQFQCLNTSSLILGHGSTGDNLSILSQKEKYQTFVLLALVPLLFVQGGFVLKEISFRYAILNNVKES